MRYLVVLLCVMLLCALQVNAALIYEFLPEGGGDILAELELRKFPAEVVDILSFKLTDAGNFIFGFGTGPIGGFEFINGSFIIDEGSGLSGNELSDFCCDFGKGLGDGSVIKTDFGVDGQLRIGFHSVITSDIFIYVSFFGPIQQEFGDWTQKSQVIPEPSTLVLLALGFVGILGLSYRQRKKAV